MIKNVSNLIGTVRMFDGVFKLYSTDNIFQVLKHTATDVVKDVKDDVDGKVIRRFGWIQPNVRIKSKGLVVGVLNKKEGLFTCSKYLFSIFKFPLKNL